MTDRQPWPGKEGRVLITPEDGSPPFYATLEMADDPLNPGTPLCKLTLLSDEACDFLDIPRSSVPSDAFIKLSLGTNMYAYQVTVKTPGGYPASGVTVDGIHTRNGEPCVTDDNGMVFGIGPKNPALTVQSPYLDCTNISHQITSDNIITPVDLTFTRADTQNITINRSKDCKFSKDVLELDMCAIGAGSGGWADVGYNRAGSGAGGSISNRYNVLYSGEIISISVGATNGSAAAGDTVISGLGKDLIGEGATAADRYSGSPSQSRNGGNGQVQWYFLDEDGNGADGESRTEYPFGDSSILCSGGGALGGRGSFDNEYGNPAEYSGGTGGLSGGGHGGDGGTTASPIQNGEDGRYYGSGGGAPGRGKDKTAIGTPGNGKAGAAMFRWRYRT